MTDIRYIKEVLTNQSWGLSAASRLVRAMTTAISLSDNISIQNVSVRLESDTDPKNPEYTKRNQLLNDSSFSLSYVLFQTSSQGKMAVQIVVRGEDPSSGVVDKKAIPSQFNFCFTPVEVWEFLSDPEDLPPVLRFTDKATHAESLYQLLRTLSVPFPVHTGPIATLWSIVKGEKQLSSLEDEAFQGAVRSIQEIFQRSLEANGGWGAQLQLPPHAKEELKRDRNCAPEAGTTILVRPPAPFF